MHCTPAGDRRQGLQKVAAYLPAARPGERAAKRGGEGPGRGRGPQIPGPA